MARSLSALIVDPNLDSRLDVSRALESVGFDIAGQCAYGTEATFMAAQQEPSIILLALEEPPMRGLATLQSLQYQLPDTPVIAYSSLVEPGVMRQAMQCGARDFLGKPVAVRDLRDAVHTVLSQEEQRQLARFSEYSVASARGSVLTVAGAKGGIGKTTLATNLAVALRTITGQEVALVDCDAQFGDVAVMLDLSVSRSVADLAREVLTIDRAAVASYLVEHGSGVRVLAAASEPDDWRAIHAEHITAISVALAETHEYVVLDTPGAMNEVVAASLNEAAVVLLLTSLDVSSIKDTKTALRILESWALPRSRVRLLVNDNMRSPAIGPEDVERATGVEVAHVLPYDAAVSASVQIGQPVVLAEPKSRYAREVNAIAARIAGLTEVRAPSRRAAIRLPLLRRRA